MKVSVSLSFALTVTLLTACTGKVPARTAQPHRKTTPRGTVDEHVFAQLKKLNITPAEPCTDAVFLRRVYLDVIGTLPTVAETRKFLRDRSPDRRSVLIDQLLEREEFADYWAMKWGDILRVKAEFPIKLWPNAAVAYHRWIRASLKANMPYDQFARELLTASGSNFRVAPVNFYRAVQTKKPEALARVAALTFMGVRTDKWEKERLEAFALFFSQVGFKPTREWKEEVIFFDRMKAVKDAATDAVKGAKFPDGTPGNLSADEDPRAVFADWLINPDNPWFARNIVNRVWHWLQGRGIIHEPDDVRPDNPPSNAALLALLENELITSKYDLKHLFRVILNSKTYQLSAIPKSQDPRAVAQFAFYPVRRLGAEVLVDALCQITGSTESYMSAAPEPFTFIPESNRTIELPDGSITSAFLDLFGRPARDTGMIAERNDKPSYGQRLHLLNSTHVRTKLDKSKDLRAIIASGKRDQRKAVDALYLSVLSRFATNEEAAIVKAYSQSPETKGSKALIDLTWALVNSTEFLYRH
ncbi:DUF1553 domain-containing protein [bacterium]|nr:DUF1553 domain-containing protein [bacterium]